MGKIQPFANANQTCLHSTAAALCENVFMAACGVSCESRGAILEEFAQHFGKNKL